jgi:predicted metalloprotease
MGPFYCSESSTVYYPLSWSDPSGRTPAEIGDFAVAVILAHEVEHHVQNMTGAFADPNVCTIQFELQADCFAGLWSRSVYEEGLLEPGDIGESLQIAANAADLLGTPAEDPNAHGTEAQRRTRSLLATSRATQLSASSKAVVNEVGPPLRCCFQA